ncbi:MULTISPECIES: anaerobic ribonucleoside-triphosphate reductase activating protein [unclassified Pseudoalteromonas]|uniref:anaerobic ribonucleoside-triphosphate reductase activating protein n=1 Tax=unclassified Pseudoalteromonas TaxID=194690 RepID=UPI000CF73A49|nr:MULTISPECIES: anaerobic ribonucleoside-triphosphate reductase activating protein [unclassified Pseudoalteromonas]MBS3798042.1 anaerobic ribonucleoside-triphosphate reductase activating protein [Pseudoalteromonas sp. BDTF-M6]
MFNVFYPQVVFQEVPDEVSLAFTVSGCPIGCKGCHSKATWNADDGTPLSEDRFNELLLKYQGLITCVLFFGGEWHPQTLFRMLKIARAQGLKTCLYTGADNIGEQLKSVLTYLKTGPWKAALGGLDSPTTNQRFIDLRSHQSLNYRFIRT